MPPETAARVQRELLAAFQAARGARAAPLPRALAAKAQLWGAALPLNGPGARCILDPVARVGVVGDWLAPRGPDGDGASLQAAALSGAELAERLARLFELHAAAGPNGAAPADVAALAVGLGDAFEPLGSHDIGGFPGAQPEAAIKAAAAAADAAAAAGGSRGNGGGSSRPPRRAAPAGQAAAVAART